MPSITKHPKGYRAYIRRKNPDGTSTSRSRIFETKLAAVQWARDQEHAIDHARARPEAQVTITALIDLRLRSSPPVPSPTRAMLCQLSRDIGSLRLAEITPAQVENYVLRRRRSVGPTTAGLDLVHLSTTIRHFGPLVASAAAVERALSTIRSTRSSLTTRRLVGPSQERDRRPTPAELQMLEEHFTKSANSIPMNTLMYFAIGTTMRLGEITSLQWTDYDATSRTILVRDRKNPRKKTGNSSKIPLITTKSIDPIGLIERQSRTSPRIFPYQPRSITAAFRRACAKLNIDNLHFHDLRHEGVSRLFEMGLRIEHVALVSGHKSWRNLARYTQIKPEAIHDLLSAQKLSYDNT